MARVTPAEIIALGEPMEDVYNEIVDELLVNISKHLRNNRNTWTARWEIEKLEEMGQLTAENAAIINNAIKKMPQILKDTMEESRKLALADIEAKLAKAAADGYLTPAITDSSVEVLRNYINQASEKLNLTNTTMLQSSVDMYQKAVSMTAERAEEIRQQGELIEGEVAGKIATGTYSRQKALKETIQKLSDAGLTGFYDRAGRSWSPEAYVNMVTRTTVHNVAIESTKARMQDYGTDVFQVSSHAGARPLCYPYQGKFYSWGGSSGTVELGNGQTVKYEPLSSTSYGEPAGLFGINCGHYPLPIIPGVTIPHGADNIEPQPQNDRNYQETQQQRALERQIREAKRVVEMEGSLATDKQRERVTQLEAKMKQFTNETGRTRRYDRERVYVAKETENMKSLTLNDWSNTKPQYITKQQRNELKEYAAQHNVTLGSIKEFDGDIGLLKETINVLSNLQEILPTKKPITLNVSHMDDETFGMSNQESISINKLALRNREITNWNITNDNYFASTDVTDIVAHEYGHVLTRHYGNTGVELFRKAYYNVRGEMLAEDPAIAMLGEKLSVYSITKNSRENVAEVTTEMIAKNNSNGDEITREFVRLLKESIENDQN